MSWVSPFVPGLGFPRLCAEAGEHREPQQPAGFLLQSGHRWALEPFYTNPSLRSYFAAYQKWDLQAAAEILIHQLFNTIPFLRAAEIQGAAKWQGAVSGHLQLTPSS